MIICKFGLTCTNFDNNETASLKLVIHKHSIIALVVVKVEIKLLLLQSNI